MKTILLYETLFAFYLHLSKGANRVASMIPTPQEVRHEYRSTRTL